MKQFHGSLDELKAAVAACHPTGEWTTVPANGLHAFRAKTGEVLNWWPTKGTLLFQGKNQDIFREKLATALGTPAPVISAACPAECNT